LASLSNIVMDKKRPTMVLPRLIPDRSGPSAARPKS